jgi:predicted acetyltransferase
MTDLIDIGVARPDELEQILELMCEAFEMPYSAARQIYYSDPYLDHNDKRVVRRNGKVVSCVTIVEKTCRLGAATVRIGGIAGLATAAAYRRRGYAERLLVDTVHALADRGCALSALFPFSRDYYRRLGWETCSSTWQCCVTRMRTTAAPAPTGIRPAESTDLPRMAALYDAYARERSLYCLRDAKRWQYLLEHTRVALIFELSRGNPEGYLLHDHRYGVPAIGGQSGSLSALRVLEMVAHTDAARHAMIAYLGSCTEAGAVEWGATMQDFVESGLLSPGGDFGDDGVGVHLDRSPGVMLRLIDLPNLLSALKVNWAGFQGELRIRLEDPLFDTGGRSLRIIGDGNGEPTVTRWEKDEADPATPDCVVGGVRGWSQVVIGYISGADACRIHTLHGAGAAAKAMAKLFPQRTPFLPAPDHF